MEESKRSSSSAPSPTPEKQQVASSAPSPTPEKQHEDEGQFLTGKALWLVIAGVQMSIFLISLDQTIVATANPIIASKFNALDQIAWITAAYFLTQVGTVMLYGQLCTVISIKWVFLFTVVIFEIGSIFCAVAPSMNFLIFGRAFAGVGGAGLFVSSLAIIGELIHVRQRSIVFGGFSAVFGIASVSGPLIGGVFSDKVTWRLCFWINLPFGVFAVAAIFFFVPVTVPSSVVQGDKRPWYRRLMSVDWIGTGLLLAAVTMLLLALQLGGNIKPWNSGEVIGVFVAFAVLTILTGIWEWYIGDKASLPMILLKHRTQLAACILVFTMMMANLIATYYLPLGFQATRRHSAEQSGVDLLPYMLGMILSAIFAGFLISHFQHYWFFILAGPILTTIGSGLVFTLKDSLPTGPLIGYQILYGAGIGACLNHCIVAVHQDYARMGLAHLIPQGTALITFAQFLGGDLGISIASTIFFNELQKKLPELAPDADPKLVASSVSYIFTLPAKEQAGAVLAFSRSLSMVYIVSIVCGGVAILSVFAIKNYSLKAQSSQPVAAI